MLTHILLALLCTSAATDAGPSSSPAEGSGGWREDPSLVLTGALARKGEAPVFAVPDGGWCVDIGRWPEPGGPTKWVWVYCPSSTEPATTPRPCQKLEAISLDLSLLSEQCPSDAVAFAE